jgi:hypothetical protein
VCAIPVVYGLSHWYLVECGLIAFVGVAIYIMAGWGESSGVGRAGLLGITLKNLFAVTLHCTPIVTSLLERSRYVKRTATADPGAMPAGTRKLT